MRVGIIGTHGIPGKHGGFETFAQEVSYRLGGSLVSQIFVTGNPDVVSGVMCNHVISLSCIFNKTSHPVLHYLNAYLLVISKCDVIICCGPLGSLFAPFARSVKVPVIINPDGLNSNRSKWSPFVRFAFRALEYFSAIFASVIVCDSLKIKEYYLKNYPRTKSVEVIEYGANICRSLRLSPEKSTVVDILTKQSFDLESQSYWLVLARVEPENHILEIVEAFSKEPRKYPLVIVGNFRETKYCKQILDGDVSNIIFSAPIYGKPAAILRANCFAYIHGHSVGGTNPSLLEAMGCGNVCVCHDNEFNREVCPNNFYFHDGKQLVDILGEVESLPNEAHISIGSGNIDRIENHYNWDRITKCYLDLLIDLQGKSDAA